MKKCKLEDCDRREQLRRGFCKKHYSRWMKYGDPYFSLVATEEMGLKERVEFTGWEEVPWDKGSPCWEWKGDKRKGYGRLTFQGEAWIVTHAVLKAWRDEDVVPPNQVRHKCDNPPCINPEHLEQGTLRQNVQDMLQRGRHVPPQGEKNGNAKLNEENIREIRTLLQTGLSGSEIARRFSVSPMTISFIKTGNRWSHVK